MLFQFIFSFESFATLIAKKFSFVRMPKNMYIIVLFLKSDKIAISANFKGKIDQAKVVKYG